MNVLDVRLKVKMLLTFLKLNGIDYTVDLKVNGDFLGLFEYRKYILEFNHSNTPVVGVSPSGDKWIYIDGYPVTHIDPKGKETSYSGKESIGEAFSTIDDCQFSRLAWGMVGNLISCSRDGIEYVYKYVQTGNIFTVTENGEVILTITK